MGGFFSAALKEDCVFDLFYGTDYHSHLGTRRAGLVSYGPKGFNRAIHNIENSPFRTKFASDISDMEGYLGVGCISDYDPQPLIVRSHHGTYALSTIGAINNTDEIIKEVFSHSQTHFLEMSGGDINKTELVATMINQKDNLIEGIRFAQEMIEGSMSIMLVTENGVYLARDKYGRTPIIVGKKAEAPLIRKVQADADEFFLRHLLGQLLQLADAPRNEPELLDLRELPGDLPGELQAKTGGCAGDQCLHNQRPPFLYHYT